MNDFDTQSAEHQWVLAEQAFMRFIGISLLITAVMSMIFGVFPTTVGDRFVQTVNIITTLVLGIGSLWSLWWSADIERVYTLVDGFRDNGASRTYAVIVIQVLTGLLFGSELFNGQYVLGIIGIIMLISAVFYFWRTQQINKYT